MRNRRKLKREALESRIYLAATAVVDDGDLVISGDAEGDIEIVAVGSGAYEVSEGGVVIADSTELQGITDDIRIVLEATTNSTDDDVLLDLGGEAVDRVYANLGGGNNTFGVTGGSAANILYRGGDGIDDVEIDSTIDRFAWICLGEGDNGLTVNSDIGRLFVRGGNDADNVALSELAIVGSASIRLGEGSNQLIHEGAVEGRLKVRGGDGGDVVTVGENAMVDDSVQLHLGNGTNTTTVEGFVGRSVGYKGGDGDDTLTVSATAEVVDNVHTKLGEGENSVTVNGTVDGDVDVLSANAEDESRIAVDEGNVAGEVSLRPGEQTAGYYHFAPGRGRSFRGFRFGRP